MSPTPNIHEDPRLKEIIEVIFRFAEGDLQVRGRISEIGDAVDGVMSGVNILGEKLEAASAERERAKQATKEGEEKYRELFEGSRDALLVMVSPSWRVTEANPAQLQLLGAKSLSELAELGPLDISPERQADGRLSAEKMQEMMEIALRDGFRAFEWESRRLNGETFTADILLTRIEVEGKIALQVTSRDITERKQTNEKILNLNQSLKEKVQQLLETQQELEQHRVHLEQEVAQRTSILTEAQRIAHLGNWEWDIINNTTNWSDEMYRIFGYEPQQIGASYETFLNAVHPEDRQLVDDSVHDALERRHKYSIEHRILQPDGTLRFVHGQAEVIQGEDGKPISMLGTFHDITELKQAEQTLHDSESRYRNLIETSLDWVWEVDENAVYTYASPKSFDIIGYQPAQLIGKTPFDLMEPEEARRVASLFAPLVASHQPIINLENTCIHKDGHPVVLETSGNPIIGTGGKLRGYRGIDRDITERKRAENMLHESEERLHAIFDGALDGIALANLDISQFVAGNSALLQMLGYTVEEFVRLNVSDIHTKQDWPSVLNQFERQARGELKLATDMPVKRKDGSIFYADINTSPVNIGGKHFIVGVFRDTTKRKQMETELRESELAYRTLSQNLPGMVYRVFILEDGRMQFYNDMPVKMTGYAADELTTGEVCSIEPLILDEDRPGVEAEVMRAIAEKRAFAVEYRLKHKDGGIRWMTEHGMPVYGTDDAPLYIDGVIFDITEQKQDEIKLQLFRTLIDNSSDAIEVLDPVSLRILDVNETQCRDLGYGREEMLAMKITDIDPDFNVDLQKVIEEQIRNTGSARFDGVHRRKDGSTFPVEVSSKLVELDKPYALNISRDITERKEAEERTRNLNVELEDKVLERTKQLSDAQEELVRKEKLAVLGRISGSIGHELRNPLGVMNNAVYFLKMVLAESDATTQEYLDIIKNEIDTSLRIITDLLDFARTRPPQVETVNVRALVDESLDKCALPENVELQNVVPPTLPAIRIDRLQMGQVLQNLLTNAIQAMPEGGTLTIRGEQDSEGTVRLEVADTGEGISPGNMKNLFQPLFTTKAKGIGLGLVVCRNLTEANDGRIDVTSEPGQGTTFAVVLPIERRAV